MSKKGRDTYRFKQKRGIGRPLTIGLLVVASLAFLGLLGYAVWEAKRPVTLLGEEVPIVGADHIPNGQKATDYNSDPPTSGQHYSQSAEAGFYEEAPPDEQLVHNLEHGHVVAYYNCSGLAQGECDQLKSEIRQAMNDAGLVTTTQTLKIVAVPRPEMENRVTYTSWGRIYRADEFDRQEFLRFVEQFRNRGPESLAP